MLTVPTTVFSPDSPLRLVSLVLPLMVRLPPTHCSKPSPVRSTREALPLMFRSPAMQVVPAAAKAAALAASVIFTLPAGTVPAQPIGAITVPQAPARQVAVAGFGRTALSSQLVPHEPIRLTVTSQPFVIY